MAKKKEATKSGGVMFSALDYAAANGVGTLVKIEEQQKAYRTYSTGSFMLDIAIGERDCITGRPGIPERAIVELFGINQSCKTATLENLIKNVLEDDPENLAVVVWAEEPDFDRMRGYGIDPKRVISIFPDRGTPLAEGNLGEYWLNLAANMSRDPRVKVVGLDSIKAACSDKQLFKDGEDLSLVQSEGLAIRANMIARFILKFKQINHSAILFMTNQTSDKIVIPGKGGYVENPHYNFHTPGGRAKEYECTLRIKSTSSPILSAVKHSLTDEQLLMGWQITYKIIKNKYSKKTASRTANAAFYFDPAGFDRAGEVLHCASYLDLIKTGHGGRYEICGHKIHGGGKVTRFLKDNPQVLADLETEIVKCMDDLYLLKEKDEPEEEELL